MTEVFSPDPAHPDPAHPDPAHPDPVGPVPAVRPYFGRVTSFDARRGIGTVTESSGAEFEFHATALVDGSRRIDCGTEVSFVAVPGHQGRYEARALTVVGSDSHHLPE